MSGEFFQDPLMPHVQAEKENIMEKQSVPFIRYNIFFFWTLFLRISTELLFCDTNLIFPGSLGFI